MKGFVQYFAVGVKRYALDNIAEYLELPHVLIMDLPNIEWVSIRRDEQDLQDRGTCILSILFILSINSSNAIAYLAIYPE